MKKKYNNIEKTIDSKYKISLNDFVNKYLKTNGDFSYLRHKDLKSLNSPFVVTVSYDYVNDNIEYLLSGYILLVNDRFNNIGCYINPKMLTKACCYDEIENKIKKSSPLKEFKDLGIIKNCMLQLNEIEPIIQILEDNQKIYKLYEIKEQLETEIVLQQVGVFEPKVLKYYQI